jgi:hypothetical protein
VLARSLNAYRYMTRKGRYIIYPTTSIVIDVSTRSPLTLCLAQSTLVLSFGVVGLPC